METSLLNLIIRLKRVVSCTIRLLHPREGPARSTSWLCGAQGHSGRGCIKTVPNVQAGNQPAVVHFETTLTVLSRSPVDHSEPNVTLIHLLVLGLYV